MNKKPRKHRKELRSGTTKSLGNKRNNEMVP
jgi:hypothetical protein